MQPARREVEVERTARRRVRFVSASLQHGANGRSRARVTLQRGESVHVGTAEGSADLPCVAEAALEAVRKAVGTAPVLVNLREAGRFEAFGKIGVMVVVRISYQGRIGSLIGFAPGDGDIARSTALAVLNATNRFLALG